MHYEYLFTPHLLLVIHHCHNFHCTFIFIMQTTTFWAIDFLRFHKWMEIQPIPQTWGAIAWLFCDPPPLKKYIFIKTDATQANEDPWIPGLITKWFLTNAATNSDILRHNTQKQSLWWDCLIVKLHSLFCHLRLRGIRSFFKGACSTVLVHDHNLIQQTSRARLWPFLLHDGGELQGPWWSQRSQRCRWETDAMSTILGQF